MPNITEQLTLIAKSLSKLIDELIPLIQALRLNIKTDLVGGTLEIATDAIENLASGVDEDDSFEK